MKKIILIVTLHYIFFFICFIALAKLNIIQVQIGASDLMVWDSEWYSQIKNDGYLFIPENICNLGFFPFFPYLWKITTLNALQISILNLLIFIGSISFLTNVRKLDILHILCIVSIPSFIFFYLPYSESSFFAFVVVLILGYERSSLTMKIIGIIGCGLSRSVSLLFFPAIILTEFIFYANFSKEDSSKIFVKELVFQLSACVLSLLAVAYIQYYQTGKWFYFIEVQKFWGRTPRLPKLPYTTLAPQRVLGVDAIAFVVGLIAGYLVVCWLLLSIRKIWNRDIEIHIENNRAIYFCSLCLFGIALSDGFFTENINNHTSLWSINRHILCTPFFIYFISWFYSTDHFNSTRDKYATKAIILLGIILTGVFYFTSGITFYILFMIVFFLRRMFSLSVGSLKLERMFLLGFYILNNILMMRFLEDFLSGKWIG